MNWSFWPLSREEGERGLTLVELLVATTMTVIITGATVSLFVSTVKDQSRVTKSADQVGEARIALRKVVDDIRQASTITATPKLEELKLKTYIHATSCSSAPSVSAAAISCEITYKCALETSKTTSECTRTAVGGTTVKVATGLVSKSIFEYWSGGSIITPSTTATYITVKLAVPASSGNNPTTLESGAALRNSTTNLSY
jgi:Tfp pilus assembly protein PilW